MDLDIFFRKSLEQILYFLLCVSLDAYKMRKEVVRLRSPIVVQAVAHLVRKVLEQIPKLDRKAWIHIKHAQARQQHFVKQREYAVIEPLAIIQCDSRVIIFLLKKIMVEKSLVC